MTKVLVVMHSLYNGGAERSLVNMLCELPEDKYEIDLLLFDRKGMFLEQVPEYVNVLETPIEIARLYDDTLCSVPFRIWKVFVNVIAKLATLKKDTRVRRAFRWKHFYGPLVKENIITKEYDTAIAYIGGEVLYFLDEKVKANKKAVWIHNDYRTAKHPKKYDYEHLEKMDAIVSISDSCVDILNEEFPEFSNKTYMIENITSSIVVRSRAKEFIPKEFDESTNCILSIGRLNEQKGFDLAIEASALMKKNGVDFKWYVIGTGELEESLKQLIKKFGVEENFILLGARENPYPYIANAKLFVQPSRYEGKSVVLDEAKILATPIVATAYPTVGDQLSNEQEGIIVEMNPNSIAEGIERLIEDASLRDKIHEYLNSNQYGNQSEIQKYIKLLNN